MTHKTVVYKYGTGNPVEPSGSGDVRDGIDNLQSMDVFMNAPEDTYNQRDGEIVRTVAGMNNEFDTQILNMGFTRIGTFAAGATLTNPRQTLLWDVADGGDGQEYGWSGVFPPSGKVVPPGSTPLTTGGISVGAWISRFDPELRIQVREALRRSYADAGYNLVDGSFEAGGTLANANDVLLQESTGKAFTGPAGPVAAGTNPTSGGFVDRSGVLAKLQAYQDLDDLKSNPPPVGSLVKWMVDDASNLSQKNGGEGIVTSSTTGTSAYIDIGNGTYIFRTNLYGPMEILTPKEAAEDHMLIRNRGTNSPSRVHMEPNGFFDGTKAKLDWMFDPYDQTPQVGGRPRDYRIFNIYTKTGNSLGQSGEAVINVKNVGDFWGVWPSMNFSVSDDVASAFKLFYFDTSDTEWRTPFKGRWREGESFDAGDYVTCANKIYRCETTGVAGTNRITHESGTVSDGNLDWTWIRSPISNISAIQPCALFGNITDMPKFGLPGVRAQYAGGTATWSGVKHNYLAGNGTVSGYFSSTATNGIVEYTSASGMKFQFGPNYFKTLGMLQRFDRGEVTATTSIDFAGKEVVAPTSSVPVNVTDFSNVVPDSIIKIIPRTNNMTLVHNTSKIRLTGGANLTMSDNNFYMFYIDSTGIARQLG